MRIEGIKSYQYDAANQQLIKQQEKQGFEDITDELMKEKEVKEIYVDSMKQQMDLTGEQMKAEREKLKIMLTCLEISRRITAGDKVPPADHRYLLKHDSGLYARSISMRFPKNNPHEYKRISQDEEREDELLFQNANESQCMDVLSNSESSAQEASRIELDIKV